MKSSFLNILEPHLPLKIERANYECDNFSIGSESWSFNSISSWRVLSNAGLDYGWESEHAVEQVLNLVGCEIVSVKAFGSSSRTVGVRLA